MSSEETLVLNGIPAPEIRSQLDLILRSRAFIQSHRIRRFLQFVVEESLLGQPHRLKEYLIGLEVFDRRDAFDPRVDSIVRVEARRLRYKLEEYYRTEGREDPVRIVLRKGSYVPMFEHRNSMGAAVGPSLRRTIEIAPFSCLNPNSVPGPAAEEIQRRLAHVLIKEGFFQVVVRGQSNGTADVTNGNGHAKADYVIEGNLEFDADHFRIILQVLHSAEGSYVWSDAADGQLDDLSNVEQLAQALVRGLIAQPGDAAARWHSVGSESRDYYLQGRYCWKLATPDSIRDSVAYFSKAVENEDNYAAAWAALAEALLVSSIFGLQAPGETGPRMREAASKAASLNALLPEAHVAAGSVLSLLDWDWTAGEQELEKSIQLDSHDPIGYIAYGIQQACRGKLDSAVAQVERALELDPASLCANFVLGWLYGVSRRFGEALAQHQLVARIAPDYAPPHLGLGLAYAGLGQFTDAIAHLTNASQMKCRSLLHGQIGYCYAKAGRREEALRELATMNTRSETHYVSPVSFAAIYSGLGDVEKALGFLEKAAEVHDPSLPVHLLSPEFDSLRNETRFQALRQRINLVSNDSAAGA